MYFTKASNKLHGIISTLFIFYTSEAKWFLQILFVYSDIDLFLKTELQMHFFFFFFLLLKRT